MCWVGQNIFWEVLIELNLYYKLVHLWQVWSSYTPARVMAQYLSWPATTSTRRCCAGTTQTWPRSGTLPQRRRRRRKPALLCPSSVNVALKDGEPCQNHMMYVNTVLQQDVNGQVTWISGSGSKPSSSHSISAPTNINTLFVLQSLGVCVCFHIMPYLSSFGRTVLCIHVEYCI